MADCNGYGFGCVIDSMNDFAFDDTISSMIVEEHEPTESILHQHLCGLEKDLLHSFRLLNALFLIMLTPYIEINAGKILTSYSIPSHAFSQ